MPYIDEYQIFSLIISCILWLFDDAENSLFNLFYNCYNNVTIAYFNATTTLKHLAS